MYKSPIEIIVTDMQTSFNEQVEADVINVVQRYGINIDKVELMKALEYDRQQYEEGYKDGVKEFAERLRKESFYPYIEIDMRVVAITDIDNLVKEMTEASNDKT